jgi:hypothetical protein
MSDEKIDQGNTTAHEQHDEITPTPDYVPTTHLDLDKETAEYVGTVATHIDPALNKKLFWTVNRRILATMLGVSRFMRALLKEQKLMIIDIFLSVLGQGDTRIQLNYGHSEGCAPCWERLFIGKFLPYTNTSIGSG